MRKLCTGVAVGVVLASATQAAARDPCLFAFNPGAAGAPRFEAYPAPILKGPLHKPVLATPDARRFRTAISTGAAAGVNFASHYTVVGWGCGSSCLDWAIVDRRTGRVHFEPAWRDLSTVHVEDDQPAAGLDRTFNALRFRPDSNLLVVEGAPQEDKAREGVTFLRWTGARLRQIAFIPTAPACAARP